MTLANVYNKKNPNESSLLFANKFISQYSNVCSFVLRAHKSHLNRRHPHLFVKCRDLWMGVFKMPPPRLDLTILAQLTDNHTQDLRWQRVFPYRVQNNYVLCF